MEVTLQFDVDADHNHDNSGDNDGDEEEEEEDDDGGGGDYDDDIFRYATEPAKFVESEVDLDESLQRLHDLASQPQVVEIRGSSSTLFFCRWCCLYSTSPSLCLCLSSSLPL